ncbi:hypothetical protein PS934_02594 [Pseudomonas fluorescens]|nr:hypothetical protein PS934_02594 [Pseudomonas fluorescens]
MPSLRSCSVGPPPSAIHGRRQLTRHPCRVAHYAEPPLGLTRGRTPQQRPRRPTGRPVRGFRSAGRYLVGWQVVIASKLAPTGTQYIRKISGGCRAVFASRLAPTVGPGMPARDWSDGRPPSRASSLPQKSKGRSAYTDAPHHSSGRALARLQLLILIHPPPREAERRCLSGDWRAAPFDAVELIACRSKRSRPEGNAPG